MLSQLHSHTTQALSIGKACRTHRYVAQAQPIALVDQAGDHSEAAIPDSLGKIPKFRNEIGSPWPRAWTNSQPASSPSGLLSGTAESYPACFPSKLASFPPAPPTSPSDICGLLNSRRSPARLPFEHAFSSRTTEATRVSSANHPGHPHPQPRSSLFEPLQLSLQQREQQPNGPSEPAQIRSGRRSIGEPPLRSDKPQAGRMSNRHLPAGQAMEGAANTGVGMGPAHGPGPSPGPRRGGGRPPPFHQSHAHYNGAHHHAQPHMNHPGVYANYMGHPYNPYAAPYGAPMPSPYQNGGQYPAATMPPQPYMYPHYARSPPMHHYSHMMGAGAMQPPIPPQPQAYARNQSPIVVSSPYQTPPPSIRANPHSHAMVVPPPQPAHQASQYMPAQLPLQPVPQASPPPAEAPTQTLSAVPSSTEAPPTPSSSSSAQVVAPVTPPTPQTVETPVELASSPQVKLSLPKAPFRPPLPWYSHPELPFPKSTKTKRRRRGFEDQEQALSLPSKEEFMDGEPSTAEAPQGTSDLAPPSQESAEVAITPTSAEAKPSPPATVSTPVNSSKPPPRSVPAVPAVPTLPKSSPKQAKETSTDNQAQAQTDGIVQDDSEASKTASSVTLVAEEPLPVPAPAAPAGPRLWTGLFSKAAAASSSVPSVSVSSHASANGAVNSDSANGQRTVGGQGFSQANNTSLAEALRSYRVDTGAKVSFLEPRGLINTGNMCYMNSVLQVLIFCMPFYDFLEQAGKKVTHRFNSKTPLIDAMIEFVRDFKTIDSAVSVDQLRRRLKSEELEQYGDPFTPEFVYEAIKKLPRFSSMRGGHQQDAEEFLGFLLESLHDECAHVMRAAPASSNTSTAPNSSLPTPTAPVSSANNEAGDSVWLEVGPKQRAAITRSSGHSEMSSPVTKIFGGQLRSELRVPGLKDSVTLEPYQPLQLDIGAPQVRNIVDALRHMTNPENLRGDFNSPRGKDVVATKQVFIESLPPVLILHLKRFQFDANGHGTVKIWKKVGYPLELEIPREVFSRSKRNSATSLPKYKLIAAVYHHGKNASGGHYTVDVRRQDGTEWVRLDDTVIRRVRSEDVAECGAEEEPSKSNDASSRKESGNLSSSAGPNRFAGMGEDDAEEDGWKQVSTPANGGKKWSSVVNGAGAAPSKKQYKDNVKDNKVAYLLFYQRM